MRILFIGNSHTYYNDMPYMVKCLAAFRGIDAEVTMLTRGGETLDGHLHSEQVSFALRYGGFDLCILQEVESGFPGQERHQKAVEGLLALCPCPVILYENFAPCGRFDRQEALCAAVEETGRALGLPVAPVGRAFTRAQAACPALDLYFTDRRHASAAGSYLVALTLLKTAFHVGVVGLPARLRAAGHELVAVPESEALALQRIVEAVC